MKLRFIFIMIIFAVIVLLSYRENIVGVLITPLTVLTANSTFLMLKLIGLDVVQEALVIYQPGGFAYEIYYRCTGFLPVVSMTVAILAYEGLLRNKMMGLAIGIPFLIILNYIRLVTLFLIGVYRPDLFNFFHGFVWEYIIILTVIGYWFLWKKWQKTQSFPGNHFMQSIPTR